MIARVMNTNTTKPKALPQPKLKHRGKYKRCKIIIHAIFKKFQIPNKPKSYSSCDLTFYKRDISTINKDYSLYILLTVQCTFKVRDICIYVFTNIQKCTVELHS